MKKNGIVVEVFIPVTENENVMSSSKIGFKVKVDNKIIEVIEEQNIMNANIHKDDKVILENSNSFITIRKADSVNE